MFVRDLQHRRTQIFLLNQDADQYDDHDVDPDVDHDDDHDDKVNLEDGFDGAPAGVSPHVDHNCKP